MSLQTRNIGPGQIARSDGINLVGLTIGDGLEISGNTLRSTSTGSGGQGTAGPTGPAGPSGPTGSPGSTGATGATGPAGPAFANLDGGNASSIYGGTTPIDAGGA